MPSPSSIITNALEDLGIVAVGQQPNAQYMVKGLSHYNRMVGELAARGLGWYEVNELFTIGVSQQSYTIGPAASSPDFVMTASGVRPPSFERAKLVLSASSPVQEFIIPIITVQIYSAIPNPAQSALYPIRIYYQPTVPNGTLWPVPYPTGTNNGIRLFWKNQLAAVELADVETDIDMAPDVEDALTWDVLRRCAPAFGRPITDDQKVLAMSAWQTLLTLKNQDPVLIPTDLAGVDQNEQWNFNPDTLRSF